MKFTHHPTNNLQLGAPPDWNHTLVVCETLPVTLVDEGEATQRYVSFWKPTDAELKALAEGALVELSIFGRSHPPVALHVEGVEE